ncbi:hypothetical protein BC829DRAFT_284333 [Chytridium lagenaria]|nr:hypothetical protein BC829DRAFT_284333 [Chytridium lagenaria]
MSERPRIPPGIPPGIPPLSRALTDDLCDMFSLQILGCVSREFQKNVVYSVLSGHDTLCIQGTGSGKTWAFTLILLVGLVISDKKEVVVVSPLVSLMADHVSDFNAKIKLFKPPKESIFPISKFYGHPQTKWSCAGVAGCQQ